MPIYVVYTAKSFLQEYLGCYADRIVPPALQLKFSWSGRQNNTIDSCIRQCVFHNFMYAGLQYSYDCFCGDSYDKHGPLPESRCNMKCAGNRNQICGGNFANSVYAVNDILWCSTDSDCKRNEACNVIDLKYTNVSRCRCIKGFHRMSKWDLCTDVDECQSNASSCNPTSENCFNNIGSYRCECKNGFVNISGQCEDIDECSNDFMVCDHERELCRNTIGSFQCHCKPGYEYSTLGNCTEININSTIGIILASLLAISLLINVLFVISRIKSVNSNQDPLKVGTEYDIQARCVQSDQQEIIYDEITDPVDRNSGYEQIILEGREIVQDPTSEYAALKHDDYLNVATST